MSSEPMSAPRRDLSVAGGATLDDDLVRALYDEHAGPLLGYVLRLTGGDRQRAEDVVQETMLRAWRHPEAALPSRGSLRPWLLTVARNIVIDNARAKKARPQEVGEQALASAASQDEIDNVLLAHDVSDALASLSDQHRDVLVQTFFLGRSVAEAATALAVPAGTVKSRTYYALRALKLALQERGIPS